jgi:hypothetical protein
LAIYYQSGHCVRAGGIFRYEVRDLPFEHWCPEDFPSDCNILKEKPADTNAEIHFQVGEPEDGSLFGWVARYYSEGWLTCDDGAGEVADFVHLARNDTLTLVHVKAATNDTEHRQVSASAYEVVASQASKNLGFLNAGTVLLRLSDPLYQDRATWHDGARQTDRKGFLEALAARRPAAALEVVIVQRSVTRAQGCQFLGWWP